MICIVGAGNMGMAILAGLVAAGRHDVAVVSRHADKQAELTGIYPSVQVVGTPVPCEMAVIATKPWGVEEATGQAVASGAQAITSVAAGVTVAQLSAFAGSVPVVRAMPNVGALVGQSATAVCSSDAKALNLAADAFRAIGTVVEVNEQQMDVVTALSGSGPAYLYLVIEAMKEAATSAGLPETTADELARATFAGAAQLMVSENAAPTDLRARVTTPNGTTAAGLQALEESGLRAAFSAALTAAAERSAELGSAPKPG